ncbi:MAG: SDR family oxidoreductase, partial [Acidimicrobiales bacterium]
SAVVGSLLDAGHAVTSTWVAEAERERIEEMFSDAGRLSLVRADVTDPAEVDQAVAAVADLDAVVNLVGGYSAPGRVHESEPADFQHMLQLNLLPGFLLARAAIPRLIATGGGSFVAVSARAALRPFAGAAGYITAKAGVLAFVQALDAEYRHDKIRCNAVLPGVIDTPANRKASPGGNFSRWVAPEAIAAVITFLLSDAAAVITGAAVPVAGES